MQAGTCLLPHVNSNVVVMWCIPPPNSIANFDVSAVFPMGEIGDIFPYAKGPDYDV